jgi:hypothetical protein
VGNGGFDTADLGGGGESSIETGVQGPDELSDDEVDDDAGLIGCSSGRSWGEERRLRRLWCAWRRST